MRSLRFLAFAGIYGVIVYAPSAPCWFIDGPVERAWGVERCGWRP